MGGHTSGLWVRLGVRLWVRLWVRLGVAGGWLHTVILKFLRCANGPGIRYLSKTSSFENLADSGALIGCPDTPNTPF